MSETKPRDVQVLPIGIDTTIVRSRSWTRLRFEIEYALAKGTTANSYLIRGDKIALIDPPRRNLHSNLPTSLTAAP